MKKTLKISFFLFLATLIGSGCNSNSGSEEPVEITDGYAGDLFEFKDAYVGNASAVGNIVSRLQKADHFKGFELKTEEEPYGIILNYDMDESDKNGKEAVIYNATFLFALIQNVDWITFHFHDREYTITKEKFKNWLGEDMREFRSEEELKSLIQKQVGDEEKVNQLFK
ncbi:DUF4825 domain-containing protein [Ammoniphilus oxalaticus]|uniref:DUF4825 domain-containing protein n=1 Tax=Ammoniphilus oxalaticus TaxID=66863 RepID=A0A419SN32_9BACL|nr:DUF4825 domain-containing protein [Ammoniphilus oxalaticus]RKD25720.1 DUF4825 domain-containing protein [Ammoniphilus oxalaticus]